MSDQILITRQQAADHLGVSTDTIARLVELRQLGVVRIGRAVRIPREDVLALAERGSSTKKAR